MANADSRKQINIAIDVVGDAAEKLKGISSSLKDLTKIFNNVSTYTNTLNENIRKLSDTLGGLDKNVGKIGSVAKNISELTSILSKSASATGASSSIQQFADSATKAGSAVKSFSSSASSAGSTIKQFGSSTKNISSSIQNFSNVATKAGLVVKEFGQNITKYLRYRTAADIVLNLQSAISSGISSIIDYDQALKDLQAITGATGLEVEQMGEKIKEVASKTKFSASEVAAGMRTLGQAGFSSGEAVQAMQSVSDLATGTLSDMSTTVDLVTTALRVFRLEASESSKVADIFGNAVNRSKLTIDKLRIAMNYVGPIARDAGVSLEETSAAMMTLANSGLRASTIGTGLRRVFAELVAPKEKLVNAAAAVGVSLQDLDPQFNSLSSVISNLGIVINDTQKAFDIFGKRGAAAVLALTSEGSSFNSMLQTVGKSGTAAAMAATQMEGLGVSIKNLKDRLGVLAISLGDNGIVGFMKILVDISKGVIITLTKLSENTIGSLVVQLGVLTASVSLLIGLFTALSATSVGTFFVTMATAAAGAVTSIVAFTGSLVGLNAGLTALSFNPVIAALAAIALAAYGVNEAFSYFTESAQRASDEAAKLSDEYKNQAKLIQDYKVSIAGLAEDDEKRIAANLRIRETLKNVAESGGELSSFALKAMQSINGLTGEMLDSGDALDEYYDKLNKLSNLKFAESFTKGFDALKQQTGIFQEIKDGFSSLPAYAYIVNKKIAEAFDSGSWWNPRTLFKSFTGALSGLGELSSDNKIAENVARNLNDGKVSWKEYTEYISELMKKLPDEISAREATLINQFTARTDDAVKAMIKLGQSGVDAANTSSETMLDIAERLGLIKDRGSLAAQALVAEFEKLKDASKGAFSDSIEKWQKNLENGGRTLTQTVEAYRAIGGIIDENDAKQAVKLQADQAKLIEERKQLEEDRKKALEAAGPDFDKQLAAEDEFNTKLAAKQKEAAKIAYDISKNAAIKQGELVTNAIDKRETDLAKASELYKNDARAFSSHKAKILKEYSDTIEKISKAKVSTGDILGTSKTEEETVKSDLKKLLFDIEVLEAKGVISHEKAEEKKVQATLAAYTKQRAIAEDAIAKLEELRDEDVTSFDPKDLEKAKAIREKLVEDENANKLKLMQHYAKEVEKIEKDIDKVRENAGKEVDKNEKTLADIAEKSANARISIERKYNQERSSLADKTAKDIKSIEDKLADDLAKIKEKAIQVDKDRVNSLTDLDLSVADKLRKARQKDMTDEQKALDDRSAANHKYAQAIEEINKARKNGDEEALKRGEQLLDQASSLYENDENIGTAVSGIERVAEAQRKAIDVRAELEKKALEEEKAEKEKKAAEDIKNIHNLEAEKLKSIATLEKADLDSSKRKYDIEIAAEKERHTIALKNLEEEAKRLNAMLSSTKSFRDNVMQAPVVSSAGSTESAATSTSPKTSSSTDSGVKKFDDIVKEVEGKMKSVEGQAAAASESIKGVADTVISKTKEAQDAVAKVPSTAIDSLTEDSKKGFEEFLVITTEGGKKVITTAKTMQQSLSSFGKVVKVEALSAAKEFKESFSEVGEENPLDSQLKRASDAIKLLKAELSKLGTRDGSAVIFTPEETVRANEIRDLIKKIATEADALKKADLFGKTQKDTSDQIKAAVDPVAGQLERASEAIKKLKAELASIGTEKDSSIQVLSPEELQRAEEIKNLISKITVEAKALQDKQIESAKQAAEDIKGVLEDNSFEFNTELDPEEQNKFFDWVDEASEKLGRDLFRDIENYDLYGYWKEQVSTGLTDGIEEGMHFPDTYKKPSHPTFSDESKYSTDEFAGGSWSTEDGKGVFTPSQDMLDAGWNPVAMQEYFDSLGENIDISVKKFSNLEESKKEALSMNKAEDTGIDKSLTDAEVELPVVPAVKDESGNDISLKDWVTQVKSDIDNFGETSVVDIAPSIKDESGAEYTSIEDWIASGKEAADRTVKILLEGDKTYEMAMLEKTYDSIVDKVVSLIASVPDISIWQEAKSLYDSLVDKTITITTRYVSEGSPPSGGEGQGMATGGFPRLVEPMIRSGSGFKDDVKALLMKGEYVLRQSAVSKIIKNMGPQFLTKLNRGIVDTSRILPRFFNIGGDVGDSIASSISNIMSGNDMLLRQAVSSIGPTERLAPNVTNSSNWSVHIDGKLLSPRGEVQTLASKLINEVRGQY